MFLPKATVRHRLFRISQGGVLSFNRTVHWRIEQATPSLSWSERCQTSFSNTVAAELTRSEVLNPVDYSICSVLQETFYRATIANISELDMRLVNERGRFACSRSWMLLSASDAVVSALVSVERNTL